VTDAKIARLSFVDGLKAQGAKVVKIQAWTLLWDDRAQMEGMLTYIRGLDKFINLVREDLEKPI
jgi:hypothetical protein